MTWRVAAEDVLTAADLVAWISAVGEAVGPTVIGFAATCAKYAVMSGIVHPAVVAVAQGVPDVVGKLETVPAVVTVPFTVVATDAAAVCVPSGPTMVALVEPPPPPDVQSLPVVSTVGLAFCVAVND